MQIMKLAQTPAPSVAPGITVQQAVRKLRGSHTGAVLVVEDGRLLGVLSERDLVMRVIGEGLDPCTTRVADVMTVGMETVGPTAKPAQAFALMSTRHVRHLAVVDKRGRPMGLVSLRRVAQAQLAAAAEQLETLEQYVTADVPGG